MNRITSIDDKDRYLAENDNTNRSFQAVSTKAVHRSIISNYGTFITNFPLILEGNNTVKEVIETVRKVLEPIPKNDRSKLASVNDKQEKTEIVKQVKKSEFNFESAFQEIKYKIFECRNIILSGVLKKFHWKESKRLIGFLNDAKTILKSRDSIIERMLELSREGHFSKRNTFRLDFSVTKIREQIFVHMPKSMLQKGTEKKIYLAIEIQKGDLVIYAKSGYRMLSNENEILVSQLCEGSSNLKKVYAFGEYFKSRNRKIFQTFMKIYSKGDAFNQCSDYDDNGKYSMNLMLDWALSAANGVKDLHDKMLTHNDVKLENFLLSDDKKTFKLTDFGFVVDWRNIHEIISDRMRGTDSYFAPERIKEINMTFEGHKMGDIYSLGVCYYILMMGKFVPWQKNMKQALNLKRMDQKDFNKLFPEPLNKHQYEHLCWRMLQYDFSLRPTIDEVIKILENIKLYQKDDEKKFPLAEAEISFCSSHFL